MLCLLPAIARRLLATACLLAVLATTGEARAQAPYFGWDWFSMPLVTDWVSRYLADDAQSDEGTRLATLPDMFGDSFARGGVLIASNDPTPSVLHRTDVLLAGGTRGLKVGEHNKAIPMNRAYFVYNHFHNAGRTEVESPIGTPVLSAGLPIDRYTIGLESRFADGLWSVEVRMPFAGDLDIVDPTNSAENRSGQIGNLSAILKRLVYYDEWTSVVVGLGVETPTGSDFHSRTGFVEYFVSNDAVHLHPYLGVLRSPTDSLFFHGFLQLDVAANGNLVTFDDVATTGNVAGRYTDQTLLYVDVGGGYWLYRDPTAPLLTGLAALVELHYTTTLNDTDVLSGTPLGTVMHEFTLANPANRMDVLNLTVALHAELARFTSLRVGGVFPLTDADNRFFDAEVSAQVIRRF